MPSLSYPMYCGGICLVWYLLKLRKSVSKYHSLLHSLDGYLINDRLLPQNFYITKERKDIVFDLVICI